MTQENENMRRIAELNELFVKLDNRGQDSALTILRLLNFAQSVMCTPKQVERSNKIPENHKNST